MAIKDVCLVMGAMALAAGAALHLGRDRVRISFGEPDKFDQMAIASNVSIAVCQGDRGIYRSEECYVAQRQLNIILQRILLDKQEEALNRQ